MSERVKRQANGPDFELDPRVRKAIENHSMTSAKRYFLSKGYKVIDAHRNIYELYVLRDVRVSTLRSRIRASGGKADLRQP